MTEPATGLLRTGAPETYKRLMLACCVFAGVALGVGSALQRPLVAVGLYAVGMIAAVAIPSATSYTLFDERDDTIHRRASGFTLTLFGWLAAIVFPSLVVLSSTRYFSWGTASVTLAWTTAAVYVTYGVAIGYYRRR
ncbi:DUF2178 domain-containing protein [Halosolutus amylolyticus]|uniref:DUF2178 domain-containing protein n=1 Tax=Halosolutus amylolyticus TaxID=2932267 RepID=A0ABD5PLB5_9EURY|nr:DUF2178 domain-containing protein [Halosolutus amylolyticus]